MEPIYIGCDHRLSYSYARADGVYLNDGTCTYTLALDDDIVASGSLTYVTGSRGVYRATIDAADLADLTLGATYTVVITFTDGDDNDDERTLSYVATRRGPI